MIHKTAQRVAGAAALALVATIAVLPGPAIAGAGQDTPASCKVPAGVTARIGVEDPDLPHAVDIYRPTGSFVVPAVVLVHGGAWREGDTSKMCRQAVYLARNGIAAISITYTLSSDESPSWPLAYDDVVGTVEAVADHSGLYGIDTSALGMYGVSAGGHLTAMISTRSTELGLPVVLGVSVSGPMELTDRRSPIGGPQHHDLTSFLGCDPLEDDPAPACVAIATAASPTTYVGAHDPPLLVLQGDDDPVVPVRQALLMEQALVEVGAPHEVVVVDSALHAATMECVAVTPGGDPVIDVAMAALGEALLGPSFTPIGDYCT